jgi:hypothetical protein
VSKPRRGLILTTGGEIKDLKPEGCVFSKDELKRAIGGNIQITRLKDRRLLVTMESNQDMPTNIIASVMAGEEVLGNALVCRASLIETEDEQRLEARSARVARTT